MTQLEVNLQNDSEYALLFSPCSPEEYRQLEWAILREGCKDPIYTWNGVILDGYDRYEIYRRHNIEYVSVAVDIPNRDAAISWICMMQLKRRGLTEEVRRYLIGKRYQVDKRLGSFDINGFELNAEPLPSYARPHKNQTAASISQEYRVCPNTVLQYEKYALAIDYIHSIQTDIAPHMLSGEIKVSMLAAIRLAQLPEQIMQQACTELLTYAGEDLLPSHAHKLICRYEERIVQKQPVSIKDMPAYDPDAEINSLAYTIPSWRSSLCHIYASKKLNSASTVAKERLAGELSTLSGISEKLSAILRESKP